MAGYIAIGIIILNSFLGVVIGDSDSVENVNCTLLNENLGFAIASFTNCAISYARPIKFCEECVNQYIDVLDGYNNMTKFKDEDGFCIDGYIHIDKLEIVQTLYDNSKSLWNRAKCYKCFQMINGTLTNVSSVETTTFNQLFTNLTTCINRTDVNASTVCQKCSNEYSELNNYYISITNEYERIGVCMDIVDVMNGTRAYWSSNCCKFRHKNETGFIISTVIVSIVTVLFYILTKFCSQKRIPVILRQTRFAGSFTQTTN